MKLGRETRETHMKFYIQTSPLSAAYILEQIPNFPKPFSLLQSP